MSRPVPSFGRPHGRPLALLLVLVLLLLGTAAPVLGQADTTDAPGPALLVDDAGTANADLQPVEVADPAGLGAQPGGLNAPAGAAVSVIAAGLDGPRFMAFDAMGNLLVGLDGSDEVVRYAFADGLLGEAEVLAEGLDSPASVVVQDTGAGTFLYVGESSQVSRFPYDPAGPLGEQEIVIPDLPVGGHNTRTVAFGPDGMLYLAVGSSCNVCVEADEIRSTVSRANPDGSDHQIIATGLRNPVGLAFQPGTDRLWATVNERDTLGNEIPPDYVTVVAERAFYGWPGCLPPTGEVFDDGTDYGSDCAAYTPPTVGIQAHSAPLGLAFLDGAGVPAAFAGNLVVVQHGSWNREPPAAPKLLLVEFQDGEPVAARDLVTGWQDDSGERWGRPAGIVVAPDGSLIVSDDDNGMIYRMTLTS